MNYSQKRYISWVLCFCLFFQTLCLPAIYAQDVSESSPISSIISVLGNSSSQIGSSQGEAGGSLGSFSIPSWISKGAGFFSSLFGGGDDDDEKQAQAQQAQTGVNSAKSALSTLGNSAGNVTNNINKIKDVTGQQTTAGGGLGGLTKIAGDIQKVLKTVGNALVTIGNLVKSVGQILSTVGKILSAIPWTAAIGQVLEKVGTVLQKVGTVILNIGNVLLKVSEVAATADNLFGELIGGLKTAVTDGWKQGGEEAEAFSKQLDEKYGINNDGDGIEDTGETTNLEVEDSTDETVTDADQGPITDVEM